jgi:hypothetical protein
MNKNSSKSKISNKIAELERCKETISNMKFIKYMEGDQMNQHTKEDFEECLKFLSPEVIGNIFANPELLEQ